jgi:two-component system chemotaxis response regulator CheY
MDITMPIMDGITALDEICSSHPDAKVVMVSSTGQKNKITECIRLGASDYITKPYEPRDVAAVLTKVLGTLHE